MLAYMRWLELYRRLARAVGPVADNARRCARRRNLFFSIDRPSPPLASAGATSRRGLLLCAWKLYSGEERPTSYAERVILFISKNYYFFVRSHSINFIIFEMWNLCINKFEFKYNRSDYVPDYYISLYSLYFSFQALRLKIIS